MILIKSCSDNKKANTGVRIIKRADLLLVGGFLLIAVTLLFGRMFFLRNGARVIITSPTGESTLDLHKDTLVQLNGNNNIKIVIQVKDGRVRFQHSDCPDQICVNTGWLSKAGQSAACVPAGVVLHVVDDSTEFDAIVG